MSIHIRVYPQYNSPGARRRRHAEQIRRERQHERAIAIAQARRLQQQILAMYGLAGGWGGMRPYGVSSQVLGLRAPWSQQSPWGAPSYGYGGFAGATYPTYAAAQSFPHKGWHDYDGDGQGFVQQAPPPPGFSQQGQPPLPPGLEQQSPIYPPQYASAFPSQAHQGWGARFSSFLGF